MTNERGGTHNPSQPGMKERIATAVLASLYANPNERVMSTEASVLVDWALDAADKLAERIRISETANSKVVNAHHTEKAKKLKVENERLRETLTELQGAAMFTLQEVLTDWKSLSTEKLPKWFKSLNESTLYTRRVLNHEPVEPWGRRTYDPTRESVVRWNNYGEHKPLPEEYVLILNDDDLFHGFLSAAHEDLWLSDSRGNVPALDSNWWANLPSPPRREA